MHRLSENVELTALQARIIKEKPGTHSSSEKQNTTLRIDRFELNSEFYAVQNRHHHIGDKEVRTSRLSGDQCLQRLSEAHRIETAPLKDEDESRRNYFFIINDERQIFKL
jgi:hypothetical protein